MASMSMEKGSCRYDLNHAEKNKSGASDSKKEMIMKSAINLFLQQGYRNTSLRQIAQVSGSSASLSVYHFGTKQAIAAAYVNEKMHVLRKALMEKVDIRTDPELFCCTFVRLHQSVMASPTFCRFYHDLIEEGVFRTIFFEDDNGINVSDLILAKRQVTFPANLHTFYSHYIIPGIELAAWFSEPEKAPCDEKLDIPFRTLMGSIYVPKEEVDAYCEQGKVLVEQLIQENPHFLEP